jgi:hypothetical protein
MPLSAATESSQTAREPVVFTGAVQIAMGRLGSRKRPFEAKAGQSASPW